MPDRRRGPLMPKNTDPNVRGGKRGPVGSTRGPLREKDESFAAKTVVTFDKLWEGYPSDKPYRDMSGQVPKGFENQCAIKISVALLAAEVKLRNFKGATVMVGESPVAIRAQELAKWLQANSASLLGTRAEEVTGTDWERTIQRRTGIVYFENYWLREGEKKPTGDHIDLWNGSRLTASGLAGLLVTAMRFGLGISSGPGFSDLAKSTKILFWPIP